MSYTDIEEMDSELALLLLLLVSVDRVTNVIVIVGNDEVISHFLGLSFRLHFILVVRQFQRQSTGKNQQKQPSPSSVITYTKSG